MENLVISLELAKRLYEAGITKVPERYEQERLYWVKWVDRENPQVDLMPASERNGEIIAPALTLQELLEVMPKKVSDEIYDYFLSITANDEGWITFYITRAFSRRKMYCRNSYDSPLKGLEALATYLLDNDLWK